MVSSSIQDYTYIFHRKLSEKVRTQSFVSFRAFKVEKFLTSFLIQSGVINDNGLELLMVLRKAYISQKEYHYFIIVAMGEGVAWKLCLVKIQFS